MSNITETSRKPWVFWFDISIRKKWFSNYWTTRGANFFEMQLWIFKISIGRPWIKSEHFGYDHVKKANKDNLRAPFSFLIGKYF